MKDVPLSEAASVLPAALADRLACLKEDEQTLVEELRLRRGYPMTALLPSGERPLGGAAVTEEDLRSVLECASRASVHTVLEQLRKGFVTLQGGHRIGLCGTVSRKDGAALSMRYLSSMSIRVARAVEGIACALLPELMEGNKFQSTLILGPPGSGKTTLLRELIRTVSDGIGCKPYRVGLADERGEVAALREGRPQFLIGCRTDIVDGCPKAEGMSMLLRGMNPQILAVDEITHPNDVAAAEETVGCGVALLATAHGGSIQDLTRRPVYRSLVSEGIFQRVILLRRHEGTRKAQVERLPCLG